MLRKFIGAAILCGVVALFLYGYKYDHERWDKPPIVMTVEKGIVTMTAMEDTLLTDIQIDRGKCGTVDGMPKQLTYPHAFKFRPACEPHEISLESDRGEWLYVVIDRSKK